MTLWIVLGVVAIVAIYWVSQYNSFVRLRNWIEEAWAQIDVQLKRRYDLIPNLVETVKGYAKHEQETLQKVIEARNRLMTAHGRAEQMEANDQLTGALKTLFALQEAYPDLKAHQGFTKLQEQLEGTENKIAAARQLYNRTVMQYNTKLESFPSNIVANVHGFKRAEMLKAAEEERRAVRVEF
ncbi:MAG: LemA family protein [Bacillota bacterium]|nr:hypothetical protein [Bacillota bacterium]REJ34385.1 MAG: hypothetical protein DIU82_09090 [Bacillota bacterium]